MSGDARYPAGSDAVADTAVQPADVIAFWRDAGAEAWFKRDAAFDAAFKQRFEAAHWLAAQGKLDAWMDSADGALALVLLLDQLPRNVFRDSAHAFATDGLALALAARAIAAGHDLAVDPALRVFLYIPYEHSERAEHQARAVELITPLDAVYLDFAHKHQDVITRFGRFPHRNGVLGRTSTAAEQAWLDAGGGF